MSFYHIRQTTFVKLIVSAMIALLIVTGLFHYYYSTSRRKFRKSAILFTFSSLVVVTMCCVYGRQLVKEIFETEFDLKNIIKLYEHINIVSALVTYAVGFKNTTGSLMFFNKAELFNTLAFFDLDVNFAKSSMIVVATKAALFPIILEVVIVLRQMRTEPERNLLWTFYTLIPILISNSYTNSLFGALVTCRYAIDQCNKRLQDIAKEINTLQSERHLHLHKPFYRMQRYCDLADKVDALAERYTVVYTQSTEFISLLAVPFVCSLICNLFGITAGCFQQYLAVADSLISEADYDVFNAMTNAIFLVISCLSIILDANLSNNYVAAMQHTGLILQQMSVVFVDVRLRHSLEDFSLLVLVAKFKMQPMGLFEVNVSLIHDVLSAVTSFLLILIQSDLAMRFSLK